MTAAITSFSAVVGIYGLLILVLLRGWRGRREALLVVGACVATVLWAGLSALAVRGEPFESLAALCNVVRLSLWLWICYGLWRLVTTGRFALWAIDDRIFQVLLLVVALNIGLVTLRPLLGASPVGALDVVMLLAFGVLALGLIDNTLVAADGGARWAVRHLLLGLAGLFAFEIFMISEAFLLRRFIDATQVAQPLVTLAVVPFLLVGARRIRSFTIKVPVTRDVVLQTTALLVCGVYLLGVAFAGALFRGMDVAWGTALQITLMLTAVLVLGAAVTSGTVRAHVRHFLERNFFDFSYDYRREWQRFIRTMGGGHRPGQPLRQRVIQALCDPLECTGGVLFLRDRGQTFRSVATWNWSRGSQVPPPAALFERLTPERPALDLADGPAVETSSDIAFIVALFQGGRLLGVAVLGRPRLRRELTWEDHELLALFAAQAANHLVEEQNARALAETRRFEAVSRRFSFVAHDLKNVVSQLAPLVRMAQRHGSNPEFLSDVLMTVDGSVEKMKSILLRLRDVDDEKAPFDVVPVVEDVVRRRNLAAGTTTAMTPTGPVVAEAERSAFVIVLENLVDNAFEAGSNTVEIVVRTFSDRHLLEIDVVDDGPGMSAEFVSERLFEPFVSSKETGFGIGMYQCRSWVENWRGELTVDSKPGAGTTVTIRLPLVAVSPANVAV